MCLRILLADDHPFVRASLRMEIDKLQGVFVAGEAARVDELLKALQEQEYDLLITDFSMPSANDDDGLTMLDEIKWRYPSLPILVLTMTTNPGVLRAIWTRGVNGLVCKSEGINEVAACLRAVAAGESYLSTQTRDIIHENSRHTTVPLSALTERETEVLRLFAAGHTITEIAKQSGRSVKTISHQKISAMNRLGLRNDPELYAYAYQHGLFSH